MKPDLSRITFIEEEKGGYSKKYRIKDGSRRTWVAKIGKEAQSETAAVRLVWGVGYVSEIVHLVPRLTIEGKERSRTCAWKHGLTMLTALTSGYGPAIHSRVNESCRDRRC